MYKKVTLFFCTVLSAISLIFPQSDPSTFSVFNYYADVWVQAKAAVAANDPAIMPSYNKMLHDADSMMQQGPWTVMSKTKTPASGNKHDLYSIGIYLWPDPSKANGLPYISKDGQINPESQGTGYDDNYFQAMQRCVEQLGMAYYFTQDAKYAQRIDTVLKVWFLDTATRMNPNLNYAQAWPGVSTGRQYGIISSRTCRGLLDAVSIIRGTPYWSKESDDALTKWFSDFYTWLTTNSMALAEKASSNNHGTWYDVQAAYYALYLGKKNDAIQILNGVKNRINSQINSTGLQPEEANRTRPMHYFCFNLQAFFLLARMAEFVDIDLWNYKGPQNQTLKKALDFIAPYTDSSKHWSDDPVAGVDPFLYTEFLPMMRMGTLIWGGTMYETQIAKLPAQYDITAHRDFVLWYYTENPTMVEKSKPSIQKSWYNNSMNLYSNQIPRFFDLRGRVIAENNTASVPSCSIIIRYAADNKEKIIQGINR